MKVESDIYQKILKIKKQDGKGAKETSEDGSSVEPLIANYFINTKESKHQNDTFLTPLSTAELHSKRVSKFKSNS